MLESNSEAFAYSLNELPGYAGDPVEFQLIHPTNQAHVFKSEAEHK
jgi:hypothetical protein